VLEGVLGRAFGDDFAGAEYIAQWDRVRTVLPEDVLAELDGADAPYGIDAVGWSRVLMALLPMGPQEAANRVSTLSALAPSDAQQEMRETLRSVADTQPLQAPEEVALYRYIACRELMDTVPASDLDVVFDRGRLVRNTAEEGTKCRELRVTAPFDSADLQFDARVTYFIGDSDVNTPAWQGAYHFDEHEGPATRVVTITGGHNSLQFNQGACAQDLMTAVAARGANLEQVATTCPLPVQIDRK
jgi:hypothetical protein